VKACAIGRPRSSGGWSSLGESTFRPISATGTLAAEKHLANVCRKSESARALALTTWGFVQAPAQFEGSALGTLALLAVEVLPPTCFFLGRTQRGNGSDAFGPASALSQSDESNRLRFAPSHAAAFGTRPCGQAGFVAPLYSSLPSCAAGVKWA
jgi:hypothetical protein